MRTTQHAQSVPAVTAKRLKYLSSALSIALLLFPLALTSLAAYRRPRNARPPSTATSTSGARNGGAINGGAIAQNGLQLTLLAPQQHVGQSQSTHPTLEWFIPVENELQGELQIYEITEADSTNRLQDSFQRVLDSPYTFTSEQGLMSFTLPAEMEGLKPNTNYIWQVLLRYGPRPSDIFMVRSQIEIIENASPTALLTTTQQIATEIEQLSEAGLWYDAIALISQLPHYEATLLRNTLLLELADIEAADTLPTESENELTNSEETVHSQALRQITEWQNNEVSQHGLGQAL